jgi:hypothetical protein
LRLREESASGKPWNIMNLTAGLRSNKSHTETTDEERTLEIKKESSIKRGSNDSKIKKREKDSQNIEVFSFDE